MNGLSQKNCVLAQMSHLGMWGPKSDFFASLAWHFSIVPQSLPGGRIHFHLLDIFDKYFEFGGEERPERSLI